MEIKTLIMEPIFARYRNLAPVVFVLNQLGKTDMHKLSKILYFADREHLGRFGRTITGDTYIAMANGPVPSAIYDCWKIVANTNKIPVDAEFANDLKNVFEAIDRFTITSRINIDIDFLSKSEVDCLTHSIDKYRNKSFSELTDISHDSAWHAASSNTEISVLDMARAEGANEHLLSYIREQM